MDDISIFLSYAFSPKSQAYSKAEIEAVVEDACSTAQLSIRSMGHPISIHLEAYLEEYGMELNRQVRSKVFGSDIAIIEISEANLNVFYELGLAHCYNKRIILIQNEASPIKLPSDLEGILALRYGKISDIRGRLSHAIQRYLLEILEARNRPSPAIRRLWNFGEENPTVINVVGPDTRRRAGLPTENYPDFAYMEFLGDKDSVVEVSIQLARLYSSATIARYPSSQYPKQARRSPMIIVGGPLGEEGVGGNRLTQDVTNYWQLPVTYSKDCESLIVNNKEYRTEYDSEGAMIFDYGIVARLPNPWDHKRRLLLIHGTHTYGVLGTTLAITDSVEGRANAELISQICGQDPIFYAWCKVPVITGTSLSPKLEADAIIPLSAARQSIIKEVKKEDKIPVIQVKPEKKRKNKVKPKRKKPRSK